MNKNFKFITGALSLMLCFAAFAFGQRTSGNIEGTITDPNGAVVPNASVTARATGTTTGFNQTVTADSNGFYQFAQVPAGTYQVTATGTGFQTTRQDVNVVVDGSARADFKLSVGGGETVVDVTADGAVTIDTTDTQIDTNITKQIIEDLPAGTNFSTLLKTAPNVRPEARAGGFQIDGASGSENVFVIDGQEVTNFRTGSLNTNFNIPFELVQEVQVKSTGYAAEFGGATGGLIYVVTPGGNDTWRGTFGASFKPAKLQGDPSVGLSTYTIAGVSNRPTAFEFFQPAKDGGVDFFPVAQLSGPIVKGKLWFSATYAPQLLETSRTIDYFSNSNFYPNPTPGQPPIRESPANPNGRFVAETIGYNSKVKREYAFARLDAQPFSRLRLFGTFLYNPIIQEGLVPSAFEGLTGSPQEVNFGTVTSPRVLRGSELLNQQGGRQNANAVNGQATWNPTNSLILNFRAGRSFLNEKLNSYGLPRSSRYICSQLTGLSSAQTGCPSQGFQTIANNFQINYDVSTRTTFDADASLVGINLAGRHNFKFGYQLNRLFNTVDQGYRDLGIIQLFYGRDIGALGTPIVPTGFVAPTPGVPGSGNPTGSCFSPNYVPGTPCNQGSGLITRFGTVGESSSDNQALFVQDSWTINNRLTLNLGVRIEKEVVPNFGTEGSNAIEFDWFDKVSPRLGIAYDLTGDGKTKLFANYGIFYDRFKYELPRGSFGGDFFRRDFFEILPTRSPVFTSFTLQNIVGSFTDPIGGQCPITSPTGFSRCQFDFRIATNLEGADIFETGAIDPDIKAARQSEYTIGAERQLGNNFVLAGRYTHKQVDRAIEDIGVFNDQGSEAYIIGNPGFGLVCEIADSGNLPCPKAQRDYDAFEVRVDKRASNYFFNASYTLSRLYGNYSGLASSDEVTAGQGRTSPNVNRFFDLPPLGFNADGDPDNGRLATDRPHVFKAFGGYSFDWRGNNVNRTSVNAFTTIQSGTPLTTIYNLYSLGTTILNERGDLGRTELFTETDLSVNHRYKFGRDNRFTLEGFVDILNLFNEQNVLGLQTNISGAAFTATQLRAGGCTTCGTATQSTSAQEAAVFQTIFNGPGIRSFVNSYITSQGEAVTGRLNSYQRPNSFQTPRDVRFGFRFFF